MGRVYAYVNVLLVVKLKLVEVNVAKTKNKFNMYRLWSNHLQSKLLLKKCTEMLDEEIIEKEILWVFKFSFFLYY